MGRILDHIMFAFEQNSNEFAMFLRSSLMSLPKNGVFVLNKDREKYEQLMPILQNRNKIISEIQRLRQLIKQFLIDIPVMKDFQALNPSRHANGVTDCETKFGQNQKDLDELEMKVTAINHEIKSIIVVKQDIVDPLYQYGDEGYTFITEEDIYNMNKCTWCRNVWCMDDKCAEKVFRTNDWHQYEENISCDFDRAIQFIRDVKLY